MAAQAFTEARLEISRDRLLFWVFLILAANSLSGLVIRSITESGAGTALASTFGVSAIVWIALAAGLNILRTREESQPATPLDAAIAVAACLSALLPIANISSVAMTGVAAYVIWSNPAGSPARRAAIIFLAVTVTLIWGRLFLGLFSRSFMIVDAFFVTNIIGSTQIGNKIAFIGQPGSIVVAPGCSSLQGISLAIVFWTTVNQWFSIKLTARAAAWCGAALLSALAINVVRIAALVNFPQHFDAIHVGWGAQLAAWGTMVAIVAIVIWGARREVFAQA